jgi:CMP/dCMP kinase
MVVAIDGPAGAGKSTVARALARELGFAYLDTGAMYRCVALLALAAPQSEPAALARGARIELVLAPTARGGGARDGSARDGVVRDGSEEDGGRILLGGRDVTDAIRSPEVSQAASRVAADPGVREALVAAQRRLLARGDWVVEGRDIGTVVAPDAALKVFLTASPEARAHRRAAELGMDRATVLAEQALRDERDAGREHGPLASASDAVVLDTTDLAVAEIVNRIVSLATARRPRSIDDRP